MNREEEHCSEYICLKRTITILILPQVLAVQAMHMSEQQLENTSQLVDNGVVYLSGLLKGIVNDEHQ